MKVGDIVYSVKRSPRFKTEIVVFEIVDERDGEFEVIDTRDIKSGSVYVDSIWVKKNSVYAKVYTAIDQFNWIMESDLVKLDIERDKLIVKITKLEQMNLTLTSALQGMSERFTSLIKRSASVSKKHGYETVSGSVRTVLSESNTSVVLK